MRLYINNNNVVKPVQIKDWFVNKYKHIQMMCESGDTFKIKRETEKAISIKSLNNLNDVWVPKSVISGFGDMQTTLKTFNHNTTNENDKKCINIDYDYTKQMFFCIAEYKYRNILKDAGFKWNNYDKRWQTSNIDIIRKFIGYCNDKVKNILNMQFDDEIQTIEKSYSSKSDIKIISPNGLQFMPFQKAAIEYSLNKKNVLIADEMGLGKTITSIGICNVKKHQKILIICPSSLKINWAREYEKWDTQQLSIQVVNKGFVHSNVVIISYDLIKKYRKEIDKQKWDCIIADECHYLKNRKAQRTVQILGGKNPKTGQYQKGICSEYKIFLSGTPILNRPIELWPILRSLDPYGLGHSYAIYTSRYCNSYMNEYGYMDVSGSSNLDELQDKLRKSFMIRRLKSDVLKDLPSKQRQVVVLPNNGCVKWIKKENQLYNEAIKQLKPNEQLEFETISKIRHITSIHKIPAIKKFLSQLLENGQKIVFFAHHITILDEIHEEFKDISVKLTGETNIHDRQNVVDKFQNDENILLFVGSIKAAGVGLTLTASSHVVFGEIDWTPAIMTQAEDRVHRIGQSNNVLVQYLVLNDSIDVNIANTTIEKQKIIEKTLNGKQL